MNRAITLAVLLSAGLVGSSLAADDPSKDRQGIMKNVGAATGVGAKMVKGEMEFDPVAAQLVFNTMNAAANGYGYLFPEGSESGNETEASPKIWQDKAGFNAAVAKFIADTNVKITDMDSFKAAFGAATKNCGSCHEAYRIKKE
ncbi:cytochrome c [Hoeflea sp. TYP-13]|uniref:c-type cytochrome n=1 Tax=Hoeflea sp. TYP-13 TaxID=3230023 RepID=UPI0034C67403